MSCAVCGTSKGLIEHHLNPAIPNVTILLCRKHHQIIHSQGSKKQIKLPTNTQINGDDWFPELKETAGKGEGTRHLDASSTASVAPPPER